MTKKILYIYNKTSNVETKVMFDNLVKEFYDCGELVDTNYRNQKIVTKVGQNIVEYYLQWINDETDYLKFSGMQVHRVVFDKDCTFSGKTIEYLRTKERL